MNSVKSGKIRPKALLDDIRHDVSEILRIHFTERIDHQAFQKDKKVLAFWAAECAGHVLPYFEEKYSGDDRPKKAIEACRHWAETGVFRMADIRKASLEAHAAAKEVKEPDAAFAAHAAGQAVATAHVPTHALGCAVYAIRAAAAHSGNTDDGLIKERSWQLQRLRRIIEDHNQVGSGQD